MKSRFAAAAAVCLVAIVAPAASALAADTYVNGATGSDANDCLQPTAGGAGVGPCLTIAAAITKAGSGDEILLADGTYNESVTLGDGKVLSSSDGDIDPKPVINGATAIDPPGGGGIDHLKLTGGPPLLAIAGPATVSGNELVTTTSGAVTVQTATPGVVAISGNSFTDDGTGTETAIYTTATSPNISVEDNTISGYYTGIWPQDMVAPAIRRNTISGTLTGGFGILVYEGSPEITANTLHTPVGGNAIYLSPTTGAVGATLSRNRVLAGFAYGVYAHDTTSLSLDSDLIVGSLNQGLSAVDTLAPGDGNVTVTNLTAYDSLLDVRLDDTHMTMSSSIVELLSENGGTCAITFSRGNATVPGGDGCMDFQTTANPLFVGSPDYHLAAGSPMIDAGDPVAPAPGALDLDGNPRGLSSTPACVAAAGRRDMGAYEFVPATGVGCPPPVAAAPPSSSSPRRKCKKGRKLVRRKGKLRCVRKKRRK